MRKAVQATAKNRNSMEIVKNYKEIISSIQGSDIMQKYWEAYQKDFEYATDIEFNDTLKSLEEIMKLIQILK